MAITTVKTMRVSVTESYFVSTAATIHFLKQEHEMLISVTGELLQNTISWLLQLKSYRFFKINGKTFLKLEKKVYPPKMMDAAFTTFISSYKLATFVQQFHLSCVQGELCRRSWDLTLNHDMS